MGTTPNGTQSGKSNGEARDVQLWKSGVRCGVCVCGPSEDGRVVRAPRIWSTNVTGSRGFRLMARLPVELMVSNLLRLMVISVDRIVKGILLTRHDLQWMRRCIPIHPN